MPRSFGRAVVIPPATLLALLLVVPMTAVVSCDETGDAPLADDPVVLEVIVPLPSGVSCSVEVTTPSNGAVLPSAPVAVTGFATVGQAVPVPNTSIVYVVDVSGSTESAGGCGGDPNGDGSSNTVLDCEITALTGLHGQAVALGTIFDAGVAVFGAGAAAADMRPGGTPNDLLTGPTADLGPSGPNGVTDVVDVLRSADSGTLGLFTARTVGGGATNFGASIGAAATILGASTRPSQLVVLVSDGLNNTGPSVTTALAGFPAAATVFTFAVGASSSCDSDPSGLGSLRDIADGTGGTCTNVPDPSNLPGILPGVIMSQLVGLELTLDGAPVVIDTIMPPLPEQGPATVNYSTTLPTPAAGLHTVCGRATCTDASGTVNPMECRSFRINAPPVALCHDVSVSADATCHASASVNAGSFDPDGDPITCTAAPPGPYSLGATTVLLTCTDSFGASAQCTGHVQVVDTTPPTVTTAGLIATLWPPNHQYESFSVSDCVLAITDNCAALEPADATIVERITSDEAELAPGSGNTCDDAIIGQPPTSFSVRSERRGNGNGRVYHIGVEVSDPSGNETPAECDITVNHDQGPGGAAVDSGCALCVGSGCGACSPGAAQCN